MNLHKNIRNVMYIKNKGITLVALVITIIILLILSGITIATLTGENGLFARAKEARLETKRAQIKEWLDLKLIEEQSEDINRTSEDIIIATRENVIKNQNELKQMGKDISIGEVLNETINENPKKINTYFEVIVDGDIYKVEMSGTKFIGNINELVPKITLESITNTTNTITVNVKTERNEGGKIEYYIKGEDEEKYTLKETTTNETYTYLNLEQNKKYNIKIVAVAKNGRTAEVLVDRTTGKVADLTIGNTTFEYSTKEWTNGNVTVTAKTTVTGFTLQTSKDGRNWTNTATQTFTANGTVYARLWDGTNYGGAASGSVTNIDKIAPTKPTINLNGYTSGTWTRGNVTITASSTDTQSGVSYYQYSHDGVNAVGTVPNPWIINGDGQWMFYVRAIDKVGNISQWSTAFNIKRDTVVPTISNFAYSDAKLNSNGGQYKAFVTASDNSSGISTYTFNLNGQSSATTNNSYIRTFTGAINDNINVTVSDVAGNTTTSSTFNMTATKVFITQLYVKTLGPNRTIKDEEMQYWLNKSGNAQLLAVGILMSQESTIYKPFSAKEQFVIALYEGILGRTPSSSEINGYVQQMNSKDRMDMILTFVNSTEFLDICKKYNMEYKRTGPLTREEVKNML